MPANVVFRFCHERPNFKISILHNSYVGQKQASSVRMVAPVPIFVLLPTGMNRAVTWGPCFQGVARLLMSWRLISLTPQPISHRGGPGDQPFLPCPSFSNGNMQYSHLTFHNQRQDRFLMHFEWENVPAYDYGITLQRSSRNCFGFQS